MPLQGKTFLRSRYKSIQSSRDAVAGRCERASGKAGSDSLRQRSGVDQPALPELVRRAKGPADPHSARTAHAERPRGEFQRQIAGQCLNANWFRNLLDARARMTAWRDEYNGERPHSSLGYRTPNEFAAILRSSIDDWLKQSRQVT